jgi:hypothetical protein
MLQHTKGNLLDLAEAGEFDIIVQGCNCFNAMGALQNDIQKQKKLTVQPLAVTLPN